MKRTTAAFRKMIALALGVPLFVVGLVLIPLPGPGLLICFAALFILKQEFEWAHKYFAKAEAAIKKVYNDSKARAERMSK